MVTVLTAVDSAYRRERVAVQVVGPDVVGDAGLAQVVHHGRVHAAAPGRDNAAAAVREVGRDLGAGGPVVAAAARGPAGVDGPLDLEPPGNVLCLAVGDRLRVGDARVDLGVLRGDQEHRAAVGVRADLHAQVPGDGQAVDVDVVVLRRAVRGRDPQDQDVPVRIDGERPARRAAGQRRDHVVAGCVQHLPSWPRNGSPSRSASRG